MEEKLKILFTIECYPPVVSGSGIATKRIATGLAKRGYKVAVACPGKGFGLEKTIEDGVIVFRLSSIPVLLYREYYFSPFARRFMDDIFEEFEPEIVHIEDHFFISTAAYIEANKRGIPVIGTNHFHPGNILPHSKIKKDLAIYSVLERKFWDSFVKVFNRLMVVTVPSNTAAQIVRDVGITRPPIYVISNGVSLEFFGNTEVRENMVGSDIEESNREGRFAGEGNEAGNIAEKYRINRENVILISVSRLEKEKRVDLLIKALALIKEEANFQYLIVGKGKERANLEKIAEVSGISDKIVFTGLVPDYELSQLYKIGDIFLTSSEIELQGLSIMEAMASGLPVIASSSMAIPELVLNGVNGYLFEPGNIREASEKILLLVKDMNLRKKMGENSIKLIKKHDFKNTLDEFERLYHSLVNSKRKQQIPVSTHF